MLTIMRHTGAGSRHRLCLAKRGVVMTYERPKVGGGFYVREHLELPYPWMHLDEYGNYSGVLDKLLRR